MRLATAGAGRAAAALAVVLGGAAGARAQLPSLEIVDVRVVEGSPSGLVDRQVTVALSVASVLPVDVSWHTVAGSATGGDVDFADATGNVHFDSGVTTQQLTVRVMQDTAIEWSPTLQRDEVFFVDLDLAANATIRKRRATVTILDDDRDEPGLQLVSVVSDGSASAGRNRLQWRVPPTPLANPPVDVLIAWNSGPTSCTSPADSLPASAQGQRYISQDSLPVGAPGGTQAWPHLEESPGVPLVPGRRYCYSLFTIYAGPTPTLERVTIAATPLDTSGAVKWSYSTGWPDVVPPTVGSDAVYTVSTDGVVHAMRRGPAGGPWPNDWNPVALGRPAHARSAVVPLPEGPRLFVGTEAGEVHAVDGKNGSIAWSRSQPFGGTQLPHAGGVQAAPAGIFKSWGGPNDLVLVGTNTLSASEFYALDPVTGVDRSMYSSGGMGAVRGMAVVDQPGNRVFFLTGASGGTLWGLDLGPAGAPNLAPSALPGGNPRSFSAGSNGSAVLRGGRLYLGTVNGNLNVLRLTDGATMSLFGLSDGEVKGFVFPDRRDSRMYFSTNGRVWAAHDTVEPAAPLLSTLWSVTDIPTPSIVLHRPGTDFLYVGGGDGRLYQIDVADPDPQANKRSVLLEAGSQIGAPSLDVTYGLVLVGSATGVVYAVQVPLL